jgi:hypothetical protein
MEDSTSKFGEDAKIAYDSYNLDSIPFDVSQIIDMDELVGPD